MKVFLTTVALLIFSIAFSQNVDFKKKNFDTPEQYNEAKIALDKGDEYFYAGEFDKALRPFKNAYALNSNNAVLNFKIGVCYFKNDDLSDALPYFKKAQKLDPKVDPKISFALAQAYQANKKYQEAIDSYNLYLASLSAKEKPSENDKVQKNLDICNAELQKSEYVEVEEDKAAELEAQKAKELEVQKAKEEADKAKVLEAQKPEKLIEKEEKQEEVSLTASKTQIAMESTSAKVTFKIQILSASKPESPSDIRKVYTGTMKVLEIKVGNSYKYYIGNYETRNEVLKAIPKTKVKGAFPVRFKNGKRL